MRYLVDPIGEMYDVVDCWYRTVHEIEFRLSADSGLVRYLLEDRSEIVEWIIDIKDGTGYRILFFYSHRIVNDPLGTVDYIDSTDNSLIFR
jgi:hypothetical protein